MKMLTFGSPQDALALLVRRRWWVVISFILAMAAAVVVAKTLPNVYVSEMLVLVKTRDAPADFIRDLSVVDADQRLSMIKEVIFSRTNLLKIAEEFKNQLKLPPNPEVRFKQLKDSIEVKFQSIRGSGTFFRITYENNDPVLAQKLTTRLGSLFIEFDNENREQRASNTTDFLESELAKVTEELDRAEATVRSLKGKYRFQLPDQMAANLQSLGLLQSQLKANAEALDRYLSLRLSLEQELARTPTQVYAESARNAPTATPSTIMEEYQRVEENYRELRAKYTDEHPDVIRVKTQLDRLKKEIPPTDLVKVESPAGQSKPNPVYDNLNKQLQEIKTEVGIREREKSWIESEIAKINTRIEGAPRSEEELESATRTQADLLKRYEELKGKVSQAKLSESFENKQKDSQYTIIDPANLPRLPAKPNRMLVVIAGLGASLVFGVFVAAAIDLVGQKVWTQGEVQRLLKLPMLGEVPEITPEMAEPADLLAMPPTVRVALVQAGPSTGNQPEPGQTILGDNLLMKQIRSLERERKTGILTVTLGHQMVRFYFKQGLITAAASDIEEHQLIQYFSNERVADARQLRRIVKAARKNKTPAGEIAVQMGLLNPGQLSELIQRQIFNIFKYVLTRHFEIRGFESSTRTFRFPLQISGDALQLKLARDQVEPLTLDPKQTAILKAAKPLPWSPFELSVLGELRTPRSVYELETATELDIRDLAKTLAVLKALSVVDITEAGEHQTLLSRSETFSIESLLPQVSIAAHSDMLVSAYNRHSYINEQFRSIKVRLNRVRSSRPAEVITICSPRQADGKTVISSNIALNFAYEFDRKAILVDCDLRRPMVHNLFGIPPEPGLSTYLQDSRLKPFSCLRRIGNLTVMTGGTIPENPIELLASDRMRILLEFLKTGFDTILLDCPPLTPFSDTQILNAMSGGTLLVLRAGKTPYRSIEKALEMLDRSHILGVILNGVPQMMFHSDHDIGSYSYYGGYRAYAYGAQPNRSKSSKGRSPRDIPQITAGRV